MTIPKFSSIIFSYQEITSWIPYRDWVFQIITYEPSGFTYRVWSNRLEWGTWSDREWSVTEAFHHARSSIDVLVDGRERPPLPPIATAIELAIHTILEVSAL